MKDLNEFEENQSIENQDLPVIGCFEVVASRPKSLLSFSIDGDDEQEIINCFKVCEKSSTENKVEREAPVKSKEPSKSKIPTEKPSNSKKLQMLNHREIQTSVTYFLDGDVSSMSHNHKENNHSLCPMVSSSKLRPLNSKFSYVSYANDSESTDGGSSAEIHSVYEYYKNNRAVEESDTAHFTPITISSVPSPPESPPKKGVPSAAYRIRYASVFTADSSIPAQMEPLAIFEVDVSSSDDELPPDYARRLPRFPVRCPITNCESCGVPSDFCNHITIDHPHIDVRKIETEKIVNMKINQKVNTNMVICQQLFLVKGKISGIGYGTFENCLPVAVLTKRMSLQKAFGCSYVSKASDENLFIYLVGVYQLNVNYTLTLWAHGCDDYEPTMIKCISSTVKFMSKPVSPKEIAGHALSISRLELQKFTNNGRKMLSCQIVFH